MDIFYSLHAEEQIEERKIEKVWIEEAIKSPDYTEKKRTNKYIVGKKLNGSSIEVVYVKEKHIKVVTVYWI